MQFTLEELSDSAKYKIQFSRRFFIQESVFTQSDLFLNLLQLEADDSYVIRFEFSTAADQIVFLFRDDEYFYVVTEFERIYYRFSDRLETLEHLISLVC